MTTNPDKYQAIYETLGKTFRAGTTRPLAWRRNQIYQLARLVQENYDTLLEAVSQDLGRPKIEFLNDAASILRRMLRVATLLDEWSAPEPIDISNKAYESWQPTINKSPKGIVLIISPWNVPMLLTLQPLYGCIAAGCPAVVKPSELVPTFSQRLGEIFNKYMDPSAYRLVNGGVLETTKLLELRWAHIFYTGNSRVARIIATAAAKHLTPCTLELGGKSPVIVDPEYDIDIAAKKILVGRSFNAGQICVSPDYVLVPREKQAELAAALQRVYSQIYPNGSLGSPDISRIVNSTHHKRIKSLLDGTQGKIVFGGGVDENNGFELTLVTDVKLDDSLMEGEIFGPILPIVPVDNVDEAIEIVNDRPNPLVLYAFTDSLDLKQKLLDSTLSGSIVFNSTAQQLAVDEFPLAGVGESGSGYQMMKLTFDGFTHMRGSVDVPKNTQRATPPHKEETYQTLKAQLVQNVKIPDPIAT